MSVTAIPTLRQPARSRVLIERFVGESGRVDRKNRVIHGVKIVGRFSRNGREYTESALRDAVPLYEGCRVFIDHNPPSRPRERTMSEVFGVLRNVRYLKDGLYGDLHYLKSCPRTPAVLEAIERDPHLLGLSHHAVGDTFEEHGHDVVHRITSVRSVDLVAEPATSEGLFESISVGSRGRPAACIHIGFKTAIQQVIKDATLDDAEKARRVRILVLDCEKVLAALGANHVEPVQEDAGDATATDDETVAEDMDSGSGDGGSGGDDVAEGCQPYDSDDDAASGFYPEGGMRSDSEPCQLRPDESTRQSRTARGDRGARVGQKVAESLRFDSQRSQSRALIERVFSPQHANLDLNSPTNQLIREIDPRGEISGRALLDRLRSSR